MKEYWGSGGNVSESHVGWLGLSYLKQDIGSFDWFSFLCWLRRFGVWLVVQLCLHVKLDGILDTTTEQMAKRHVNPSIHPSVHPLSHPLSSYICDLWSYG
jgi:hypothetical protein